MERPPGRGKAQAAALNMVQLLPNLITLGAGCAGLTAIRLAFDGHVATSVSLIMLAALLDLLDGFTARLLQSTSAIGAELDSLVDIVNFGVAPGLVLYIWALDGWRSSGWIAVLIFAICAALRLARGGGADDDRPLQDAIPAPAAHRARKRALHDGGADRHGGGGDHLALAGAAGVPARLSGGAGALCAEASVFGRRRRDFPGSMSDGS